MARRSRPRSSSGLPYLAVGLALGLAVAAGVYFSDLRSGAGVPTPQRSAPRPERAAAPTETSASTAGRRTEPASRGDGGGGAPAASVTGRSTAPSYEFYDVLPRYEVVVPESRSGERAARRGSAEPVPVVEPGRYVLQAGSFRSHADADRMQASLALLGVESQIHKVAIGNEEYHRVRIGPISDLGELNRIRSLLGQAGIESLMMKAD